MLQGSTYEGDSVKMKKHTEIPLPSVGPINVSVMRITLIGVIRYLTK